MADSGYNLQRIILDVCDPYLTKCWVYCQALGDSPMSVHGWHFKAFTATVSTLNVLQKVANGEEKPVMWPQAAPEEMPPEATIHDLRPYVRNPKPLNPNRVGG